MSDHLHFDGCTLRQHQTRRCNCRRIIGRKGRLVRACYVGGTREHGGVAMIGYRAAEIRRERDRQAAKAVTS